MRKIGIVTGSRSDYGIFRPLLNRIMADKELDLYLLVTGMHLSPEFGRTVQEIEADGFEIGDRIEMLLSSDTPEAVAKSMGLGVMGFAQSFHRIRPDILVVLGDRFEMHSAALAALPYRIPIAHLHGGEITRGAFDESLRHSITKLSHLHFVATREYAARVVQLGEEPWRVTVSGALSLDNLHSIHFLEPNELETRFNIRLDRNTLLVTFHSVTLEFHKTEVYTMELLMALDLFGAPVVFTLPNADTNGRIIIRMIRDFVQEHDTAWIVESFGTQGYFSMMNIASAMVGNSSSGIIEAASFELPVVNIGSRQQGRVRGTNVIDVECTRSRILEGLRKAHTSRFQKELRGIINPYDFGGASEKIVPVLKEVRLDENLIKKHFYHQGD